MAFNLLDSVRNSFDPGLISKAATLFGENENGITKTLSAGIPALLSGIISNATSDGGNSILNLSKQAAAMGIADNSAVIFGEPTANTGTDFLSGIFGSKSGILNNLLSGFTGVKQSTTSGILGYIAPLALGLLGKHALSNNLSGTGLLGFLNTQKQQVMSALPAGLNLSGVLDDTTKVMANTAHAVPHVTDERSPGNKLLIPLLLAILGIALLWYLMKGCNQPNTITDNSKDTTIVVSPLAEKDTSVAATSARESLKVKLPDGTEINAYKGGIEDKLVSFLNDPNAKADKDTWFDFDDLNFKTGTAEIVAESQNQLSNIGSILKAYPKVKIKIGGYTDKTGSEDTNKKLSQSRAAAVKSALTTAGVGGQVTDAEGYGSSFAKYAADAPDSDRIKDRRVSVSVREK